MKAFETIACVNYDLFNFLTLLSFFIMYVIMYILLFLSNIIWQYHY